MTKLYFKNIIMDKDFIIQYNFLYSKKGEYVYGN